MTLGGVYLVAALAYRASAPSPLPFPRGGVASLEIWLESPPDWQKVKKPTVTDQAKIEALTSVMRNAWAAEDHKCSETGQLMFALKDGSSAWITILPGHDPRYFEYRVGPRNKYDIYRVDRGSFGKAMAGLGATNLVPPIPR